jgi:hypothetical protein
MRECACLLIRGVHASCHLQATTRVRVAVGVVPGVAEVSWSICCASWSVRMRMCTRVAARACMSVFAC